VYTYEEDVECFELQVYLGSDSDGPFDGISGVEGIVIGRDRAWRVSQENIQGDGVTYVDGGHLSSLLEQSIAEHGRGEKS